MCPRWSPRHSLSAVFNTFDAGILLQRLSDWGWGGVGGWGSLVWLLSFLLDGSQKVALRDCPPRSGGGSSMGLLRGLVLPPTFFPH